MTERNYTKGIIREECLKDMDAATFSKINEICRQFWENGTRILSKPARDLCQADQEEWNQT